MAIVNITPVRLGAINEAAEAPYTAITDTTLGAAITSPKKDANATYYFKNGNAADKTVTISAGNGHRAGQDLTITVPHGSEVAVQLDSGYFLQVSGTYKGKILAIPNVASDISVKVTENR